MKNIILGNGINIQFGGLDNTNNRIIDRAILKLKLKDYSQDVYTDELRIWIKIIMVYKLYELTYNEVKIVEPEFVLTKKEYMNYEL